MKCWTRIVVTRKRKRRHKKCRLWTQRSTTETEMRGKDRKRCRKQKRAERVVSEKKRLTEKTALIVNRLPALVVRVIRVSPMSAHLCVFGPIVANDSLEKIISKTTRVPSI
ncbi:unnamed protein product [Oppiella nova]|uniref:Uncharacterized protein n=1 Tax=Oppiella nova TaxID=334625 RepID=A0A7R9R016_9ACAR|nr:unnamed protein product [Oppiella nova]CAG2180526.1 unnamed protein product [Oppiella nova]